MVLEGLGRSLDPNLDILDSAKPLLLKNYTQLWRTHTHKQQHYTLLYSPSEDTLSSLCISDGLSSTIKCTIPLWITCSLSHHYILAVLMPSLPHWVLNCWRLHFYYSCTWILLYELSDCSTKIPPTIIHFKEILTEPNEGECMRFKWGTTYLLSANGVGCIVRCTGGFRDHL